MADNVTLDPGTGGATIATDDDGTAQHQYVKLEFGADNTQTKVTSSVGLPVDIIDNFATAAEGAALGEGVLLQGDDGTDRKNVNVDATTGDVQVDVTNTVTVDGSGVTQPVSAASLPLPTGAATAANQLPDGHNVTIDNASGASAVNIQDGGNTITVDGTVATTNTNIDNLHSSDFDSGAGTDTTSSIGIAFPASGGAVVCPGDSTNGMTVNLGSNNDVTVTGTVTADLGATDNAVLDQIEVNTSYGDNTGGGTEAGALRVTVANDSTGVLSVDDNGGSLTVDGTVGISGTVTVDLGANNDVTLNSNSGVDIGDVDVISVVPGTGATNLGKAIDTAAGGTDTGVAALAIRDDSLTTLTPVDGDYVPLRVSSTGALHVTGGGGGTERTDDTDTHATGSSVGTGIMAVATPTDGSVDANDFGHLAMSLDRRLHVDADIVAQSGAALDVSGATVTVDLGANNDVTIDNSSIVKTEDAVHSTGDAGVMTLAVRNDDLAALAGTDGDYAPLQVTQNGALLTCQAANDDYKYAVIDDATSGDNTLVAAVASRKIRVLSAFMIAAGTVNARFEDGAAGTALTGQMNLIANVGFTLPYNPGGWFETSVNTLLNLELSAAVSVDGCLTYIEVP